MADSEQASALAPAGEASVVAPTMVAADIALHLGPEHNVEAAAASDLVAPLIRCIRDGRYAEALALPVSVQLLGDVCGADAAVIAWASVEKDIRARAGAYVSGGDGRPECVDRSLASMYVGVAALQLFQQANWTGPPVDVDAATSALPAALRVCRPPPIAEEDLPDVKDPLEGTEGTEGAEGAASSQAAPDPDAAVAKSGDAGAAPAPQPLYYQVLEELVVDGEVAFRMVSLPSVLLVARALLVAEEAAVVPATTAWLWQARCLYAHQRVLDSPVAPLHDGIFECIAKLHGEDGEIAPELVVADLPAQIWLEQGLCHHHYLETVAAMKLWTRAQTFLGMSMELSGAMGSRTKFQTKPTAQLLLNTTHGQFPIGSADPKTLPQGLELNDDTRLETIEFADEQNAHELSGMEQATIMNMCANVKNTNPMHGITNEEMAPYVQRVLSQPIVWGVQYMALRTRSVLEFESPRSAHRSIEQITQLILHCGAAETASPVQNRMHCLCTTGVPPLWELEKSHADLSFKIGLIRDSLGIFTKWEMWDRMLDCHQLLQQDTYLERLVWSRMKVDPTATLWCVLGDIKRSTTHYEKAWEVSKHKSARAMRSLGFLYLMRAEKSKSLGQKDDENYRLSLDCYKKATDLNRMRSDAWFSQGCAALNLEEWQIAVTCFRAKLDLDHEDFQAWNNLSKAFIHLKEYKKAFSTLREATKHSTHNWKVYDNLLAVAVTIGEYSAAIQATNMVINLKGSFDDWKVIQVFVRAATDEEFSKLQGRASARLKTNLATLLDRLEETSSLSHHTWSIYADFYDKTDNADKARDCRKKAYQQAKAVPAWQEDEEAIIDVAVAAVDICQAALKSGESKQMNTAKLQLKSVAKAVKAAIDDGKTSEALAEKDALLASLHEQLMNGAAPKE